MDNEKINQIEGSFIDSDGEKINFKNLDNSNQLILEPIETCNKNKQYSKNRKKYSLYES